ncbi:MAG: class I SAM-dependent methyltransferase [Lentisphaerae bacterium]|nr:class I SAM-dependent methyltransferase [Lentisphaerota bacterium]
MSTRTLTLDDRLYGYLRGVSLREPDLLRRLREETAPLEMAGMQISPEQGQFMGLMVRVLGARRALEVGVFTGYSSLSVALALPADGELVACDVSAEWTSIARRYWAEAGVAGKIDLRLAPAADTLRELMLSGQAGAFDFAFIDADKGNYDAYYEACLELIRPGGVICIDNVLWGGRVADDAQADASTVALRALNRKLHDDARIDLSLLPLGDGVTLARKR